MERDFEKNRQSNRNHLKMNPKISKATLSRKQYHPNLVPIIASQSQWTQSCL